MDKLSDIRAQDVHSRLLTKKQLSEMALGQTTNRCGDLLLIFKLQESESYLRS